MVCAAAVASINPCSRLLEWVIRKLERSSHLREEAPAWRLKFFQVLRWIGLLGLGWILNACSLGCVLVGIGQTVSLSDLPVWICAAAGSTSLGFLVLFAPGGLGVRDALLMGLLQMCTPIATAHIVVIAVLVRLVSLISELLFALLLYLVPPKHPLAQ
ncbi:MAG: hypothetical protein KDA78_12555 [Planctomycetaceae bacterium]|nr:hypothetical protein [Planctomycetaceae bacterium]